MPLQSRSFRNDSKLQACAVSDPAHVIEGAVGDHVGKIQQALRLLDGAKIDAVELAAQRYGKSTAAAVLAYKTQRRIINYSYQRKADNIVGKMTIGTLDRELLQLERSARASNACAGIRLT